jgi:N-acetylated-alpha-linked acidic dipeptidase
VEKLAKDKREQIVERNRLIEEGAFQAIADPRIKTVPPSKEPEPPFLNFAPLDNGLAALQRTTALYDRALTEAGQNGGSALARAELRDVNQRLTRLERVFLVGDGLPNRPWFEHQIYAPGFYTGYGVKTLPGVREAIEQKEWKLAQEQIERVGKVFENAGEAIQGTAADLTKAVK